MQRDLYNAVRLTGLGESLTKCFKDRNLKKGHRKQGVNKGLLVTGGVRHMHV